MRHVLSSWRKRAALLTVAGVAVLAAAVTSVVVLNTGPAAATWQTLAGNATCDCVVKNDKDQYRAVFGYTNPGKQTGRISVGDNNRLQLTGLNAPSSSKVDGVQTTTFDPGTHKAAFATGWVSKDVQVTWAVGGKTVAANWSKPTCGRDVSLPATGNGSGPIIALLASLLIVGAAILVRKRRSAARSA